MRTEFTSHSPQPSSKRIKTTKSMQSKLTQPEHRCGWNEGNLPTETIQNSYKFKNYTVYLDNLKSFQIF